MGVERCRGTLDMRIEKGRFNEGADGRESHINGSLGNQKCFSPGVFAVCLLGVYLLSVLSASISQVFVGFICLVYLLSVFLRVCIYSVTVNVGYGPWLGGLELVNGLRSGPNGLGTFPGASGPVLRGLGGPALWDL